MLGGLGPSGLLRLTAVLTLGATLLLAGCASTPHSASQLMSQENDGWSRCERGRTEAFSVVCLKR